MDHKLVGGIVIACGAVILVLSALADPIGLGEGGGFGWQQTVGVLVGALGVVGGFVLMYLQRGEAGASQAHG